MIPALRLLAAMAEVVCFWLFLYATFWGWGMIVRTHLFALPENTSHRVTDDLWMGWFFHLAFLQVWHLFFPVALPAFAVCVSVGLLGLGLNWKPLSKKFPEIWAGFSISSSLILLIMLFLVANISLSGKYWFDVGLYHLQLIRWIEDFPIVPGLGNLHLRFAANSPFHLYAALLDLRVGYLSVSTLAGGSAYGLLLLYFHEPLRKLGSQTASLDVSERFLLLTIPALALYLIGFYGYNVPSFMPDLPVFLLGIAIAYWSLRILEEPGVNEDDRFAFVLLSLGSLIGTEIKVSMGVFSVGMWLSLLIWHVLSRENWITNNRGLLVRSALVMGGILAVWLIRGVLWNGYLVSSVGVGGLPVEWRTPAALMDSANEAVATWARHPGIPADQVSSLSDWLIPWLRRMNEQRPYAFFIPLSLALGIGGWFIFLLLIRKAITFNRYLLLVIPVMISIIVWFFTAPDPRFAGATLWLLPLVIITSLFENYDDSQLKNAAAVILAVSLLSFQYGSLSRFVLPQEFHGIVDFPKAELATTELQDVTISFPIGTDGQCWDAPLPCIPSSDPSLQLRCTGNVRCGFMLADGVQ